jgi:hypothetical protein
MLLLLNNGSGIAQLVYPQAAAGRPGFDFQHWQVVLLFPAAHRPAVGPTQPPTQWVLGTHSRVVKLPNREADHSSPCIAEVKNSGAKSPVSHASSQPDLAQGNFYLYISTLVKPSLDHKTIRSKSLSRLYTQNNTDTE